MEKEHRPMPPCLMPLQQLNRCDGSGTLNGDRTPSHASVPESLQQPNRLDGHGTLNGDRTPPHAPYLMPLQQPNRLDGHGTIESRKKAAPCPRI
ncbi:hypothetical protein AVEN_213582-1 [Araneus ventricosus]|uniref:Uncharacterized protein n=1 Tax=Araneus ventricosus TaxID=182803 RepID=A0A4Y2NHJ1_ARAVE|nr:hypothetical protein AVEN_213582-1 [Araneus ventricosus]